MNAFFITGSGTEVGKTYVGAAILSAARAQGLRTEAVKPLMSGFDKDRLALCDAGILAIACGRQPTPATVGDICLYQFEPALSPHHAAAQIGLDLDDAAIVQFVKARLSRDADLTLVEGAGGVMSPVTYKMTHLDLMEELGLPAILVTANYLGAITHTLTALAALDARAIPIAAIIVCQPSEQSLPPEPLASELAHWRSEPSIAAPFGAEPCSLGVNLLKSMDLRG